MKNLALKHTSKTLQQLNEEFLGECQYSANRRSETIRGYRESFKLFMKLMPEAGINKLTPEFMAEFFKRLNTRTRIMPNGKKKCGVKNSTLATYRNKLDKFFTWLLERRYIKRDPFFGLPYPEVNYTDRKYLYDKDITNIFTALTCNIEWRSQLIKRRNIAMYSVLLYCGLRKGELMGLELLDINMDKGFLFVRAEISKSKIDREIPLNSPVMIALKDYLQERRRGGYKTPYLWVSETGYRNFTVNGLKHLNQKVSLLSGVKFHPHQFRHTFSINLMSNGSDAYRIKELLGHRDIRMTEAYLRCLPRHALRRDVERLKVGKLV